VVDIYLRVTVSTTDICAMICCNTSYLLQIIAPQAPMQASPSAHRPRNHREWPAVFSQSVPPPNVTLQNPCSQAYYSATP